MAPKGFSLIEVVIAISVAALTFIGLIGLLGLGVANDQASSEQTVATSIAASILADLRSTPAYSTTGKSNRYGLTLPTTAPNNSARPLGGLTTGTLQAPVLYFDNTATFIPPINSTPVPANATYAASVYLARIAVIGPTSTAYLLQSSDMARVVVSWPARTTTTPAGSVDVISQFLIH
jgi:prepilin-type N-terminal cleavage/methylation domain-containing protein